jgi:hypothetical protein
MKIEKTARAKKEYNDRLVKKLLNKKFIPISKTMKAARYTPNGKKDIMSLIIPRKNAHQKAVRYPNKARTKIKAETNRSIWLKKPGKELIKPNCTIAKANIKIAFMPIFIYI